MLLPGHLPAASLIVPLLIVPTYVIIFIVICCTSKTSIKLLYWASLAVDGK